MVLQIPTVTLRAMQALSSRMAHTQNVGRSAALLNSFFDDPHRWIVDKNTVRSIGSNAIGALHLPFAAARSLHESHQQSLSLDALRFAVEHQSAKRRPNAVWVDGDGCFNNISGLAFALDSQRFSVLSFRQQVARSALASWPLLSGRVSWQHPDAIRCHPVLRRLVDVDCTANSVPIEDRVFQAAAGRAVLLDALPTIVDGGGGDKHQPVLIPLGEASHWLLLVYFVGTGDLFVYDPFPDYTWYRQIVEPFIACIAQQRVGLVPPDARARLVDVSPTIGATRIKINTESGWRVAYFACRLMAWQNFGTLHANSAPDEIVRCCAEATERYMERDDGRGVERQRRQTMEQWAAIVEAASGGVSQWQWPRPGNDRQ